VTANSNKLVMGDGLSDVQSWSGTTTLGGTNAVLTVRSTATAAQFTLREGGGALLQVPGALTGTTLQFGTNAAGTSGTTLRLSDGATAGSATFTTLTINGSGHKVVGGATGAGRLNLNLSVATSLGSGLSLGGAGANENNFNVVKTGAGVLTLSGANTFNGFTRLDSGGGIVLANANALQNSTLTLNGGGSVVFSNGAAFTVGGLAASSSGSGFNLALTNTAGSAVALSVGGNNQSTTYAGVMSGGGSLVKAGSGTLTLTGANTYSGGTTVNGGALAGTTTGIRGNMANNAAVIFDQATAGTYGNVMSGTGTLIKRGAGTLTITNANTYSGVTSIEQGALTLNTTGSLAVESGVVMAAGAGLVINRNTASVLSNTLSGAGSLTRAGTGDLTLAASNSHTGGTFMGANNLVMGANGALGYGVFSMDSSANTSRLLLNGTTNTITGLTLAGANAQVIQNDGTGGSAGRLIFDVGAGETVASASTLIIRDRTTATNADQGTLSLVKTGAGTLDLSQINTVSTRYSGGLTISAGAVSYTNLFALGDVGSTVTLGGGKLNYAGSTDITNSRAVTLVEATTSTMENAVGNTVRHTGIISGSGSLTKTGAGTLDLAANNSYTGSTTVNAGSLIISGDQSGANGVLSVASGAILGGSGIIGGATTISGSLRPGNSIGTLTVANDVTWNAGENWVFELGAAGPSIFSPGSSDLLAITGGNSFLKGSGGPFTFDFAGSATAEGWYKLVDWAGGSTTFDVMDFAGVNLGGVYASEFAIQDNALYVNVVPEPSTYALLILAGAGLAGRVWRRRARR
jgi:autotransporter-associated beta strand protein